MKTNLLKLRRVLSATLFVLLLNVVGMTNAFAYDFSAECSTGQTLYYNITDATNHYVEVTCPGNHNWSGYTAPTGDLVLPSMVVNGNVDYQVVAIGEWAFCGCSNMTSIEIPNSVTSLGVDAFRNTGLTSIVIPNTITTLETYTFYNCSNLITVTLPDGLEIINSSAFEGCSKLTTINIPNTVTTIGNKAFYGCSKLASIQIPSLVTTLSDELFRGCSLLANFEIPNTVTTIGNYTFYGCSNLTSIDIPTSVTSIGSGAFSSTGLTSIVIPNSITVLSNGLFNSCQSLTSVVIPNSVTEIESTVFMRCIKLPAINIPSSVITIGSGAFRECEKLTTITIPNSVVTIGYEAFWNCTRLLSVEMGNSIETIGNSAFKGCEKLETINIPNTVETIGNEAFSNCKKLTEIVIPNSVISIGNSAFSGCSYLESVEIGNSVETIGVSAFSSCTRLTSIVIPNSVMSIGSSAFSGCSYLESAVIGNSVETIGQFAFSECSRLSSIVIPNYVVTIGNSAFKNCAYLTSVQLGNSLKTIGNSAFEGCSMLTSLAIPETVESIGSTIIRNCQNLEQLTVVGDNLVYDSRDNCNAIIKKSTNELVVGCKTTVIPNTVVSIGSGAFYQCPELTSIVIPNSVTMINTDAFRDCNTLTSVVIGNSVTTIKGYVFCNCEQLTSVVIGESVETIGTHAFYDCTALASITSKAEVPPTIGSNYTFYNVIKNIPVYVPVGSVSAYQSATYWSAFSNIQEIPSYNVAATSNPAEGGEVSGGGSFEGGEICTLTATANVGYAFINWTENGQEVSTDASYTFTVTAARELVANFSLNSYEITASANPAEGGNIEGAGNYNHGASCTLTATANLGSTFINWTENGQEVSTDASYTFTVTAARELVANFSLNSYEITASANPTEGGNIEGSGNYNHGASCTLTATANAGYTFINWTENGQEVSSIASYTFTVTEARELVANFSLNSYEITASANPTEGGSVTGEGTYNHGLNCTMTATTNSGYVFQNWTENDEVVSTDATYTFTVTNDRNLVANFRLLTNYWTPESSGYSDNMALTGVIFIDGEEQRNEALEVGVFCGDECRGAQMATYFQPTDRYLVMLMVYGNSGDNLTFKIYDHISEQELDLNSPSSIMFNTDGYGTLVEPYFLNFTMPGLTHTRALVSGWNWYSTYIELNGINGLEMLENSLGGAGIRIQGRNGYTDMYEYQGTYSWYGTLNGITNEQMYKIRTSSACNAVMIGDAASAANHPITINPGWNWIGYPVNQSVSITNAMSGFTPTANDVIKSRNGYTTYIDYSGYTMWYGTLNNLEPGQGYMYQSFSSSPKTLVFQTGKGDLVENITSENNIFRSESSDFSDNMNITAVIDIDGEELRSEDYELAAFIDGECRGSVKLMYVEPIDRYVAFLTVFGENSENINFVLTDGNETKWSDSQIVYASDAVVGTPIEPAIISFGTLGLNDNELADAVVYPNPTKDVFNIQCEGIRKVEVLNVYGQVVISKEANTDNIQIELGDNAAGAYMLRIYTSNGMVIRNLVKNN